MRTTKTAKASIIRIAPPIVEEPSESLEPLKELFEKEETAYRLSFTKSMETGIYASYRSIKECAFSNITFIDSAFKSAQISDVVFQHLFRRKFLLPGRVHRLQIDGNQFRRVYIQSCTDDKLQQPVHQPRHEQNEPDAI